MNDHPLILLVEDDADLRECVEMLLVARDYAVESAANGQEALDAIERNRPDLILLDMKMPVMNGWQFCRALDARGGHPPPIVVVTAAHDPAGRAAEVHAQAWLGKPFELDDVESTVRRVLSL